MTRGFSSLSDNGKHTFRKEVIFGERDSATFGSVHQYYRHLVTLLFLTFLPFLQGNSICVLKQTFLHSLYFRL